MFILTVEKKTYRIEKEITTIGRHLLNDIVINGSKAKASRYHAKIILINGRIFLKDLKTVNGTFIKTHRILPDREILLKAGDTVGIGTKVEESVIGTESESFIIYINEIPNDIPLSNENEVVSTTSNVSENDEFIDAHRSNEELPPSARVKNRSSLQNIIIDKNKNPSVPPDIQQVTSVPKPDRLTSDPVPFVKMEPISHSADENSNVTVSPSSFSDANPKECFVPSNTEYLNVEVKQAPSEQLTLKTHSVNLQTDKKPTFNTSNESVQHPRDETSASTQEVVKTVCRMFEKFFAEKVASDPSTAKLIPILSNKTNLSLSELSDCHPKSFSMSSVTVTAPSKSVSAEFSTNPKLHSVPAANKNLPIKTEPVESNVILEQNPVVPILHCGETNESLRTHSNSFELKTAVPIENSMPTTLPIDLTGEKRHTISASIDSKEMTSSSTSRPVRNTRTVSVLSDMSDISSNEESINIPLTKLSRKNKRRKRSSRTISPVESATVPSSAKNVINLCETPSEASDVVDLLSDDENRKVSHRSPKRRKCIDRNCIVIDDLKDDELMFSDDVISCVDDEQPRSLITFDSSLEKTDDLPAENNFSFLTSSSITPVIDLCDDVKPFIKHEMLAQVSYSNLEEIIALDSDEEDFPSSQLFNTTQTNDVPDFTSSFEMMFDEQDYIKEEPQVFQSIENTWFDQFSQSDTVEGKCGFRMRPTSTSEHDVSQDETDADEEDVLIDSGNNDRPEKENQASTEESNKNSKSDVRLQNCCIMLTRAEPIKQDVKKLPTNTTKVKKSQNTRGFDEQMLELNNVYKAQNYRTEKKTFKKLSAVQTVADVRKSHKRKSRSPSMTVQEKKLIKMKRREKLKEIVPKKSQGEADPKQNSRLEVKPVVKVTDKNRGSFLTDEIPLTKKEKHTKSENISIKNNVNHSAEVRHRLPVTTEKSVPPSDSKTNDATLVEQIFNRYCKDDAKSTSSSLRTSTGEPPAEIHLEKPSKRSSSVESETDYRKSHKKKLTSLNVESSATKFTKCSKTGKNINAPVKSNLRKYVSSFNVRDQRKSKKRVQFRFNTAFKMISSDPDERQNNGIFASAYKSNEGLIRDGFSEFEAAVAKVCSWNVRWLEEQQRCIEPPPLYPESSQNSRMLHSAELYKERLKHLMFFLVWRSIFNFWNKPDNDFFPHTQFISEKSSLSILKIELVDTSKSEKKLWTISASRFTPVNDTETDLNSGQLVILNFPVIQSQHAPPKKTMVFAYVSNFSKVPYAGDTEIQQITFKVFAKDFQIVLGEAKLKVLNYLKSSLRQFQALGMIIKSPLSNLVIEPNKNFTIESAFDPSGDWFSDKFLDMSQRNAITTCLNCIHSPQPSLCLVDGAAGTGKSQVIVSLLHELFSKSNRHRFPNSLKILIVTANDIIADDLCYRIEGLNKKEKFLNLLRYGNCRKMHAALKNCTLDKKIQDLMTEENGEKLINIEEEKNNLEAKINASELVLKSEFAKPEKINEARQKLSINRRELNDMNSKNSRVVEQLKYQVAKWISIKSADVVITSLFSCWSSNFENDFVPTYSNKGDVAKFTTCIFDDASLINETGLLIPLMLMVPSLILIGDQRNQLTYIKEMPPFQRLLLECSRSAPAAVAQLCTQYRSPPYLIQWISECYDLKCKIKNIPSIKLKLKSFFVFDVQFDVDDELNVHYENQAHYCSMLLRRLNDLEDPNVKFGVIVATPLQKEIIKSVTFTFERGRKVIVDSLEEFSGREQDVIILCLPYNHPQYSSWLYLAVTRAKFSLFVCGDFFKLSHHHSIKSLAHFAKSRSLYSKRDPTESDIPSSLLLASS